MRSCTFLLVSLACLSSLLASNPAAQKAFKEGLRQETAGHWKEAETAYTLAIQQDAGDGSFYQHRAKVRSRAGEQQLALQDCEKALGLLPGDAEIFETRGNVYSALKE